MSIRIPERVLRAAFGAILVLSGLKLIEVPGWALAAAALAAVTAFVLWFVADHLQRRGVAELS